MVNTFGYDYFDTQIYVGMLSSVVLHFLTSWNDECTLRIAFRKEKRIRDSEQTTRQTLQQFPIALLVKTEDDCVLTNRAFANMLASH